jgi:hypothetical protein
MTSDESSDGPRFDADEGWYSDPWGRHEARWMSAGTATNLVKDGDVESQDPPPNTPPAVTPTRIHSKLEDQVGAADLKRADAAEAEFIDSDRLQQRLTDAAEEGVDGSPFA